MTPFYPRAIDEARIFLYTRKSNGSRKFSRKYGGPLGKYQMKAGVAILLW